MRVIVADTGPLNYLVLIGEVYILLTLFTKVFIPDAVRQELSHSETPASVRAWLVGQPSWLTVQSVAGGTDADLQKLDVGERDAVLLALALHADLVLMDDRAGVAAARDKGLMATGTLGLIDLAARRGLLDVAEAVPRLRATSFCCRSDSLQRFWHIHGIRSCPRQCRFATFESGLGVVCGRKIRREKQRYRSKALGALQRSARRWHHLPPIRQ